MRTLTATTTGAAVTPRVLALATLLVVGARTLCNGVDGHYYGTAGGGHRYPKLDKFMHDRMGLDNRTGPPVLTTDRGLLARTVSVAAPEDEDYDGGDDEEDEEEDEELQAREPVRLRHHVNHRENDNDLLDKNVQHQEPARTMSPFSEMKWKYLGTRKDVEETFRSPQRISILQGDNSEAYKHQMRMLKETSCKVPRPRVVRVSDVYPSSNKKYIPSCTLLHVCADDTGCCNSPTLKCGPKSSQAIYLHFLVYTMPVLGDRQPSDSSSSQKSLLFYNHTECECQSKMDDVMPRDSMPTAAVSSDRTSLVHHNFRVRNDNDCKCPTEYTIRYLANGSCSCDCFDKQRECIRYKKGNVYFNRLDRYCITSGQCLLPMCEYGVYSHRKGRCPKKFDNLYNKKHYF